MIAKANQIDLRRLYENKYLKSSFQWIKFDYLRCFDMVNLPLKIFSFEF